MNSQAKNNSSSPDHDPTHAPTLIDVELEPFSAWRNLPFAILLGGTFGLVFGGGVILLRGSAFARYLGTVNPIFLPIAVGLVAYVIIRVVQRRRELAAERRMRSQLVENQSLPIADVITAVLNETMRRRFMGLGGLSRRHRYRRSAILVLRGVTRGLARGDRRDLTVRACKSQFAVPIQPIEMPIEPLPLDESVPFVAQLGDADQNDFDDARDGRAAGATDDDASRTPDESDFRRRFRRNMTLQGGRWVFGLFLFAWAINALTAVIAWRLTWSFVMWTALLGFFAIGPGGRGAWRAGQQWLIVPGGLVSRKSNRRGGWDVHLFDRRASVLTVYRHTRNHWFICVADADKDQMAVVTPTESIALLRAWLSPLEPPPAERLQELAG